MSKRREESELHGRRGPHTYSVKWPGDVPPPVSVVADRFEIEGDAITFITDDAPSAVVRGSWLVVVQQPDVVVAEPGA